VDGVPSCKIISKVFLLSPLLTLMPHQQNIYDTP
jgi:hypothetical protein